MTKNNFKKNAIRKRMALTGESYLEATRLMEAMPPFTLDDLIKQGVLNPEMAEFLRSKIAENRPTSFIITGDKGSGKSTLLAALAAEIPQERKVSAISEKPDSFATIYYRSRTAICCVPNGDSEFQPFTSVRHAMYRVIGGHRPDHLIVDEIRRSDELTEFLWIAGNGHSASTTIKAHDAHDVLNQYLNTMTDQYFSVQQAHKAIATAVDLIIVMEQAADGSRRCSGIYEMPDPQKQDPDWNLFHPAGANMQTKITWKRVIKNEP